MQRPNTVTFPQAISIPWYFAYHVTQFTLSTAAALLELDPDPIAHGRAANLRVAFHILKDIDALPPGQPPERNPPYDASSPNHRIPRRPATRTGPTPNNG